MASVADFRRLALALPGVEESSHMGSPDFRVGGRIFATLAAQALGYGNLLLTLDQQQMFVEEAPAVFLPVPGGWGRGGATHMVLAEATEDVVAGALHTAWKVRLEKNEKTPTRKPRLSSLAAKSPRKNTEHVEADAPNRTSRGKAHRATG